MAAHCLFFPASTAFTVCALFCSADDSPLLILPLVNGFYDSLRAVLRSRWQWIAHSSVRQRLLRRFARCFPQRMAADCSFLHSLTSLTTVFVPYCWADGSGLLILPLVNGFPDGLRALLLTRWQRIARSSARQRLSRFARRFPQRMAAHCSFFPSSTAFTVCALFCSADDSPLLILPLVNGFYDSLRAVLLCGWQWIAHSSARQWLSRRFAHRIAQQMAAHCSFFRSSTAFMTVRAPFCSADGSGLLILPLVNGFHNGSRAVLLSGGHRISHTSARQRLSRRFARRIALRMTAHRSFVRSPKAFTVRAPFSSADGSASLLHPLAKGFHSSRAVFLSGL